MGEKLAGQEHDLLEGEQPIGQLDCTDGLRDGATISSIVSIESIPVGLTISSEQVNSGNIVVNGRTVSAGKGVTFVVSGDDADVGRYLIKVVCLLSNSERKGFLMLLNRLNY